jgi:hypothetical protein
MRVSKEGRPLRLNEKQYAMQSNEVESRYKTPHPALRATFPSRGRLDI